MTTSSVWQSLRDKASAVASRERIMAKVLTEYVLERTSLEDALSWRLSSRLAKGTVPESDLRDLFFSAYRADTSIIQSIERDLEAVKERDPACDDFLSPFLYFKGFQALSAFRVAHWLWGQGRHDLALYLQSLISVGLRRGYSSCCGYWQRYSS